MISFEKVIIESGDILGCPLCLTPQVQVLDKIKMHQAVYPSNFKYLIGRVKMKDTGRVLYVCRICRAPWHHNGSWFSLTKGWIPNNPYAISVQSETDALFNSMPKHF